MKILLLVAGAFLVSTASSALAAGQIHLAVSDCGVAGSATVTNNCTTNIGAIILIGSVISPVASTQVIGFESLVDVVFTMRSPRGSPP